ncbi:MAG: nitrogen regulation protein NR(II) [Methylococcales bacterium]|nr:nitrogen regulation protein NR(II) [Methylococcales bacterium]
MEKRILENLNTAILFFNSDLLLTYVNPAAEMLFELSSKKMLQMTAKDIFHCPGEVIDVTLIKSLESGQPFIEREMSLPLPDKRIIKVDCSVTPLNEPNIETNILVELRAIDRQIRISHEEQLISQHHATRALIRGMAHEIKNPLGGIRGAAQLLEEELNSDDLKEYTQVITREADRLKTLLNRMLGPNKLPKQQSINIHQVLERVRMLVKAEMPKNILFHRDYDPSLPDTQADEDLLIQAVLNIVRNAAQAIGQKGNITLKTSIQRQFTLANHKYKLISKIEIINDGPKIPDYILKNIFYPMISGRAEGTGLGLSISQSIINQHDGLIECLSEDNKTTFIILLPLKENHD